MHRLYYHETPDAFYFASDAKALLALCPETRSFDPQGLGEFIACGTVLENRTLFKGIRILPPGSLWIFENGRLAQKTTYFNPKEWEEQEPLDPESYDGALRDTFAQILPRYFAGSRPIAMSLTGGLDTRMILACRRPEPGSLPCYTFGSMFHENQDVRVARQLATVCGQSHQVLTAGPEFLQNFASYAERTIYLTSGCVDVGRAPDLYLNELARQIAPVRMTGNYGGEILRSVRAFKAVMPASRVFTDEVARHVEQAGKTFAAVAYRHPVSFSAFQQAPWSLYGVLSLEQTQLEMRSPFLDNDLVRLAYRSPAADLHSNRASIVLVTAGNLELLAIPTDRGTSLDGQTGGGLRKRYLEFSFKAEYAYDMGMPQWLARIDSALRPLHLERLFLGRHKPFHFRIWYRDALAGYLKEMLLDERALSRPHVDRKGMEAVVLAHTSGRGNYTTELHKLLTLELVQRLLLD
jgi:asparagine synthase (glutamine-hydrolysing)